jgi:LAGLIDADG DNA endonuclease family
LAPQHLGWTGRNVGLASANNGGAQAPGCGPIRAVRLGNTVGSLTEEQQAIVTGSLLGDGAMRCKTNALLEVNHSWHQQAYVEWKYRQLAELVSTPPKLRKGNGGRISCRFLTRSLPALTLYFNLFYASGKKAAPELELSPLALAVWFMDDGCKSRNAVYLNTQQFDLVSQQRLLDQLHDQWGIEGTLNKDESYHRIRISVAGTVRLAALIDQYLLPELRYKLPQVTP